MVEISDPINVWVFFKNNQPRSAPASTKVAGGASPKAGGAGSVQPHLFFWHNRQIKIDQVNLIFATRSGTEIFYHFSISSGSNFYRLKFNATKLKWFLEAVEEG